MPGFFLVAKKYMGVGALNSVVIVPTGNLVDASLFDVTTTTYFLSENMTQEEHKEV
jgi:hypothetical protein